MIDIPESDIGEQQCWKIQFLGTLDESNNTRSPVLNDFLEWKKKNRKEFAKIVRAMTYAATHSKHIDPKFVKEDREKRGGFEFRNNRCNLRLLFFYDDDNDQIIICTNTFKKSKNKAQDEAFAKCARLKDAYFESKGKT